jgi:1-acyl-sn-glycerol-3-phosphate acyltransferase
LLGEHGHYAIRVWRDLLEMCGMVRGTRDNVRALMREDEHVLVFPGGADEVFKRRGQKYQLLWKERLGFARLAIEFGYPIVPFAAVGAEEMYDVVADDATPGYRQVSALMKRLVGVPLPPEPRGAGPTLLPRPERLPSVLESRTTARRPSQERAGRSHGAVSECSPVAV